MRLAGRITEWNEEKGFGFVMPNGGGARAFVHVNDFHRGSRRPVTGDLISYSPALDARGRTKARQIRHAGEKIEVRRTPSRFPRSVAGFTVLALGAAAAVLGYLPLLVAGGYFGLSALSYLMYWTDKRAAQRGASRTPEATLHLVDLLGGWPGALIAQQQFRHKTAKAAFQVMFWASAFLNLAVVGWLVASGTLARLLIPVGH